MDKRGVVELIRAGSDTIEVMISDLTPVAVANLYAVREVILMILLLVTNRFHVAGCRRSAVERRIPREGGLFQTVPTRHLISHPMSEVEYLP